MKAVRGMLCGALVAASPAAYAETSGILNWNWAAASEFRFFSWEGNRGFPARSAESDKRGRGIEIYVPYAVQLVGRMRDDFKIELLGRGGWVWARQKTAGLRGEVSTVTDTIASGTVTYYGIAGIQPFASINFNIPTGRSSLSGSDANARMDPDLVEISSFGEGFNIGPSVGFNLPITSDLVFSMSAGYTWRGTFKRENSLAATDLATQSSTSVNPGDVLTITASLGFQFDQLAGTITGSYSQETATTENGVALYRPGRRYLVSGKLAYSWSELGVTSLSASFAHSDRNDVVFARSPALTTEPFNTNSNVYRIGIEHLFPFDPLWIGPTGSFLYRDHNAYDPSTFQFVPAKERWTAGLVARLAAGEYVTLNARFEHVWTHEHENPSDGDRKFSVLLNDVVRAPRIPLISSTGWQAAVGITLRY